MNNVVVVDTSIALKWVLSEVDSDIALALMVEWTNKEGGPDCSCSSPI